MQKPGPLDPLLVTEDGYYCPPPPLPSSQDAPAPSPPPPPQTDNSTDESSQESTLTSLSREQLIQRLISAEKRLAQWQTAASDLVTALALSPEMTETFYSRSLRALLENAISSLESVDRVNHVECSMPCVHTQNPHVSLLKWSSLIYSEWHLDWSPSSWWVSVSIDGSRWGIGYNCLTHVSEIHLQGTVRCSFSSDLTSLRFSFLQKPNLEMKIESSVGWGVVPIPIREQIEQMVRDQVETFVEMRLTGENDMVVVLRRKAIEKLSDLDIQEATLQAKRSSSINLRSTHLL